MMKRNILAVVIPALLVAGAANAAEIYNKNGNKLDFYGKVVGEHDFSGDNTNNNDDNLRQIGFKGETQINDQLTGYGQWEYLAAKRRRLRLTKPVWLRWSESGRRWFSTTVVTTVSFTT
jgi:outer membrane pore protein F